ncbi:class I adenylate-forming enzyme family protein [Halomonas sp. HK25]|uniref:class I adenylate-forming enzyme family protein n=1 Tax=Halomonas sp. HK25 TaxID=3394321 RepID=UPI0039FB9C7A
MKPLLTMHNPAVARQYYIDGYWKQDTYYSLLRQHAHAQPRAWALRDSRNRLTYAQLLEAVDELAVELHSAGLVAGDRVSIWLPNAIEAVVIFLACSRNGYVANTSLHQNYTVDEVIRLMTRMESGALFAKPGYGADADRRDIFSEARKLPFLKCLYTFDEDTHCRLRYVPVDGDAKTDVKLPAWDTNADKVSYLAFTSGTTGEPKGVMHSDNTLLANGRAMVEEWGLVPESVIFTLSPLSHHIGTVALSQMLVAGAELVVNDCPPGLEVLDYIRESGATYVMGVPTHAMDLLAKLHQQNRTDLGQVRTFYMAGSPIPREVAQAFLDMGIRPQNVYGMTENGSHQFTLPTDDVETVVATCGRACKGFEVSIWDQEDRDRRLGPSEIGEIASRGAQLMLGYFANQHATQSSFNRYGWFMSGDLGWLDENGCLHIAGRKKDLIIRGGHNIHPSNIEALAIRHPGIAAAAAVPVPDERLGEKVCLAVVNDQHLEPYDVLEHLNDEGLSKYDMPEYFITMDTFPMTASGKILKRQITEWVREGKLKPEPVRWTGSRHNTEGGLIT